MLDLIDFGRYPHGPEFGKYGVLDVRHGKAQKGPPPKRRSVLCVWDWVAEVVEQWSTEVRPLLGADGSPAPWPSERDLRFGSKQLNRQQATYRDKLGLDPALDFHSLRHAPDRGRPGPAVRAGAGRSATASGCARSWPKPAHSRSPSWWSRCTNAASTRRSHRCTGWQSARRSACRCRFWPRCATSSRPCRRFVKLTLTGGRHWWTLGEDRRMRLVCTPGLPDHCRTDRVTQRG
ncbi:hypothetical protein SAMN05421837_118115 [Amycolatopsis pretoriensis]|uniref:Phage integrase family protein n=1 Tax=Amycolatopsis pretoriensis TaxID=218821 RepID=A0A1H5RJA2_9PSEU|nr:hypothetical protein SAMN05421837_118115 [Amycolatopsis pretoriensis]